MDCHYSLMPEAFKVKKELENQAKECQRVHKDNINSGGVSMSLCIHNAHITKINNVNVDKWYESIEIEFPQDYDANHGMIDSYKSKIKELENENKELLKKIILLESISI